MKNQIAETIHSAIVAAYPDIQGIPDAQEILAAIEIPPERAMGDYAYPCFKLAKVLRSAPPVIAKNVCEKLSCEDTKAVTAGGYLNFFLDRESFAKRTLENVENAGGAWGSSSVGSGKTICLDYSSINIAKRFSIGHLTTTVLGHSLARIFGFLGYKTVSINHLGDWGTQFGKMLYAYKTWGSEQEVTEKGVSELLRLYVKFHEEAEKDPSLDDEGRTWFKRIEEGDEEATRLFQWFKELTLRDTEKVYQLLGITFDSYAGESFYNDKMGRVIDELSEKGLLKESEGAKIVDLEEYGMPPCLIVKKDGATLYATRDIAAALYRKDTYDFDQCLYVVAYQQDLHFRQWFKVVELMGYDWAKNLKHVSFGMISYEGQTLSTRKGHIVFLEDLLKLAEEKALEVIEEKNPGLPDKKKVARQVGIGAVVYADLTNNRIKDIDFWWDRVLSFDGETGPYVQYTHARCCSLLQKAADAGIAPAEPDFKALCDDEAQEALRLLSRFPDVVKEAAARYEPSLITRAVTDICQAYNKYYYEHRILDGEPEDVAAKVLLTRMIRDTVKTGLYLIGIEAPEKM